MEENPLNPPIILIFHNSLPHPLHPETLISQPEKSQNVVDLWFQLFSDILGIDQLTKKLHNALYLVLGIEEPMEARIMTNLPEKKTQRVQRRKIQTVKEFRLVAQLDEFEIKDVMLDLGSDVNILPKNTWEALGKPELIYSPI
jgi:hypothetical protein